MGTGPWVVQVEPGTCLGCAGRDSDWRQRLNVLTFLHFCEGWGSQGSGPLLSSLQIRDIRCI